MKVTLQGAGEQLISQTLVLSAADKEAAEFGLRSDKLRLLAGEYTIASFTLYDGTDEPLYSGMPDSGNQSLNVIPGGLVSSDLHVSVTPRGKVRFTLTKNMDSFASVPQTKGREGKEYIFEQIAKLLHPFRGQRGRDRRLSDFYCIMRFACGPGGREVHRGLLSGL